MSPSPASLYFNAQIGFLPPIPGHSGSCRSHHIIFLSPCKLVENRVRSSFQSRTSGLIYDPPGRRTVAVDLESHCDLTRLNKRS